MEKVKESPCVLIRKKEKARKGRGLENVERGAIEDVLILIPPSVSLLGNMGTLRCAYGWFGKQESGRKVWTLSLCLGFGLVGSRQRAVLCL